MTTPSPQLVAYVDASAVNAVALEESGWEIVDEWLDSFPQLMSSTLLEAEMRSRQRRAADQNEEFNTTRNIHRIEWYIPDRRLGPEIDAVLQVRYLRGGDLLHAATALYLANRLSIDLTFLTLDNAQREAVAGLSAIQPRLKAPDIRQANVDG